jgi:putative DNA-invertase from lambdoid prophage Rac
VGLLTVPALERKGFSKLLDRLEEGDVPVVTKLDRLGRNAIDVRATVERLEGVGVPWPELTASYTFTLR